MTVRWRQASKVRSREYLVTQRRPSPPVAGAVAFAGAALSTLVVIAIPEDSTTTAALIYVVGVVASTWLGGVAAGLVCAALSFLALNYLFTPPLHTLRVDKSEDLVALLVFIVIAVAVGVLFLSSTLEQRRLAERREQQARVLHALATRLLAGHPTAAVLERFARAMVQLLPLDSCVIDVGTVAAPASATRPGAARDDGRSIVTPLVGREMSLGSISVTPSGGRSTLEDEDRAVIALFASQLVLALDALGSAEAARAAEVDAETNKLRAALFSSVTHDLRTPLTSITASATSLLDERARFIKGQRVELLETIKSEAQRLDRLVGNLMNLSRVQAGALSPAKVRVAVDELIENVVRRMEARSGDHLVRMVARDDLPEIEADVVLMDQVLTNLLENAFRYAPPGSEIAISAAVYRDVVRVGISDRGRGIGEEDRERVFEPFVRTSEDGSSGTGLGLAIARAVIVAHGGRIWIAGTPGGGTTVWFELPLKAAS